MSRVRTIEASDETRTSRLFVGSQPCRSNLSVTVSAPSSSFEHNSTISPTWLGALVFEPSWACAATAQEMKVMSDPTQRAHIVGLVSKQRVIIRFRRAPDLTRGLRVNCGGWGPGAGPGRVPLCLTQSLPAQLLQGQPGFQPPRFRPNAWLRSCHQPRLCRPRQSRLHGPCGAPGGRCGPR